jgi:flagellar motility protein MotE (MotC chaperone)
MYASASDAAEKIGCTQGNMSWVLTGRMKTCKGMKFCYVADIMDHLEEIADIARKRAEKETAYDAIVAREKALKEANDFLAKHQAKYEELLRQLAAEEQELKTAEAAVNNLIRG